MSSFFRKARIALLTAGLALIGPLAGAQDGSLGTGSDLGNELLGASTGALQGLVESLVTFLQVAMGVGAIVVLVIVIFQVFQGEREAAKKLAWWVAGLTLGFTLLTVVSNIIM